MDKNQSIPKSEATEAKSLNKYLYKAMGWLGLTSGIGIVGIGAWWFIWCLVSYIFGSPQNIMQQQVYEYYFMEAQLGVIVIALGVIIMEIKMMVEK